MFCRPQLEITLLNSQFSEVLANVRPVLTQGGQVTTRFCVHEHRYSCLCSVVWWLYL